MDLHTAKCALLDLASYATWRKEEPLPESLSSARITEAVALVWEDTFGSPMQWYEKCGMHMQLTMEEEAERRRTVGPEESP